MSTNSDPVEYRCSTTHLLHFRTVGKANFLIFIAHFQNAIMLSFLGSIAITVIVFIILGFLALALALSLALGAVVALTRNEA